jgi:D-alanyl-D-alanine carboxypeptidase
MSTLALAIIHHFPQYYHFFDTPSFRFDGRTLNTFDHLLDEYPGADGMKTGYIYSSGFNVVTSAVRGNRRLVGVVLGGATARSRDLQMIALLNQGFATPFGVTPLVAGAAAPPVLPQPELRPASVVQPARPIAAAEAIRPPAFHPDVAQSRAWIIQVGDRFPSRYSVYRVLRDARRSAPTPLRRGRPDVIRLRDRRYLARFSDLSYPMARRACSALEARRFSCRILPHNATRGNEFADTAAAAILPSGE